MRLVPLASAVVLAATCLRCSVAAVDEPLGVARTAIVGGERIDSAASPVLFLHGPEGLCTAVLIAPNLAATARHCVAPLSDGTFDCTAAGELQPGSTGGRLGPDNAPSALSFYSSLPSHVAAGIGSGTPDAIGAQIFSLGVAGAPSACRDDIAFVVLDRAMTGLAPAPVRLDAPTRPGEAISLWGYGFTEEAGAPIALRVRHGTQVLAVGPDAATDLTQPAPVRAIRVGPGSYSCNGDSGGPILSESTGAVVALVSLGVQANTGPDCLYTANSNTTGPRLGAYRDLALAAFAAAGAAPISESPADGGANADVAPIDGGAPDGAEDANPNGVADDGGAYGGPSCSAASRGGGGARGGRAGWISLAVAAAVAIRRGQTSLARRAGPRVSRRAAPHRRTSEATNAATQEHNRVSMTIAPRSEPPLRI